MNNFARIQVDIDAFRHMMGMPINTNILDIQFNNKFWGTIDIIVEHPDLSEVKEGERIPTVQPVIHQINWDWNQHE